MRRVRCPAVSRLQKIHNVDLSLSSMRTANVSALYRGERLDPRDIVDGHREKTLALLWCIVLQLGARPRLPVAALRAETAALERTMASRGSGGPALELPEVASEEEGGETAVLLLHWVRLVCAMHAPQVKPSNLSTSFSDGRALCLLLSHYQPHLLPQAAIQLRTTQSVFTDSVAFSECPVIPEDFSPTSCRPKDWDQLVRNELENQRLVQKALNDMVSVQLNVNEFTMFSNSHFDFCREVSQCCYVLVICLEAVVQMTNWSSRCSVTYARACSTRTI